MIRTSWEVLDSCDSFLGNKKLMHSYKRKNNWLQPGQAGSAFGTTTFLMTKLPSFKYIK